MTEPNPNSAKDAGSPIAALNREDLDHLAEVSKNARKTLFLILLGCAYCVLAIVSTSDAELLGNTNSLSLPVIDVMVSVQGFYIAAPLVLLIVYFYLHLYLQDLWLGIARFLLAGSKPELIAEQIYPWIVSIGMLRAYAFKPDPSVYPLQHIEKWSAIIVGWWAVPLVILMFWLRYLMVHDWWITMVHSLLLSLAIVGSIVLHQVAVRILQSRTADFWAFRSEQIKRLSVVAISVSVTWLSVAGLSFSAVFSAPEASCGELTRDAGCGYLFTGGRMMAIIGRPPYAILEGNDIDGASLQGRDIRFAQAANSTLRGANLRDSDMRGIDLQDADLSGADLSGALVAGAELTNAKLNGAYLMSANLERADLFKAELESAQLNDAVLSHCSLVHAKMQQAGGIGTDLSEADLRYADMTKAEFHSAILDGALLMGATLDEGNLENASIMGANLSNASLERAILSSADLSGSTMDSATMTGAELFASKFENVSLNQAVLNQTSAYRVNFRYAELAAAELRKADLRDASFQNANLNSADLSGAWLQGARLDRAKLAGASLHQANMAGVSLVGADLTGVFFGEANLSQASLREAVGLVQEQLDCACGDSQTELPEGLSISDCYPIK